MKLCVFGSQGRMGKLVREEAGDSVIACYDTHPPARNAGEALPAETDVVIDFSLPSAWNDLDTLLSSSHIALVSGTTGLGTHEEEMLRRWSRRRPVFYSSNMSRGIYVLGKLLEQAAMMLKDQFSLEIVEYHHSGKVDSPSGTAMTLAEIWQGAGGGSELVMGRSGSAGPRSEDEIGI
ncbi:MAG: 4-hydroxy-tetrahydrodipicolinate reductase, partial [Candidatus Aegiribacteria sp.]|nr:4-hydroxy-tetrahydrodipicolinate reductase [Candidatus Aegiribacteria sp.]